MSRSRARAASGCGTSSHPREADLPPFPKPRFSYDYDVAAQLRGLRAHRDRRDIPAKRDDRLLLATWNVANLGVQERTEADHELIAEIVGWFDLVAIQEANDRLAGIRGVLEQLPPRWRMQVSEAGGNRERTAFLYDGAKVDPLEQTDRLSIPPSDLRHIKLKGVSQAFRGFDRGPYLGTFRAGRFSVELVNVHLFFGSDSDREDIERRMLEAFAVARWCDLRRRSPNAYVRDIVALGDFNLPELSEADPIYSTLTSRGLELPAHKSAVGGSSLDGHKHYDQVAFFPGETSEFANRVDVFDFDNAVFSDLFEERSLSQFLGYVRYHLSDHRPLWAEFAI
ncbi:MAG: endonuclease/exonuclease/phosphatase family protein [Thermoleophilaceae bacterium]